MTLRVRTTDRRGGTYVPEFALIVVVFFLFFFGVVEYGRMVATRQIMENAAREGARFACAHTHDKTTANVQDTVVGFMGGIQKNLNGFNKTTSIQVFKADPLTGNALDANNAVVTDWTQAPFTNAGFSQGVAVRITGTYQPILPTALFLNQNLTLSTTSIVHSEAN